jgi:hypothetical protein
MVIAKGYMKKQPKNQKELTDFILYYTANPDLRFWQALSAWSGYKFIYRTNSNTWRLDGGLEDTFYVDGK